MQLRVAAPVMLAEPGGEQPGCGAGHQLLPCGHMHTPSLPVLGCKLNNPILKAAPLCVACGWGCVRCRQYLHGTAQPQGWRPSSCCCCLCQSGCPDHQHCHDVRSREPPPHRRMPFSGKGNFKTACFQTGVLLVLSK